MQGLFEDIVVLRCFDFLYRKWENNVWIVWGLFVDKSFFDGTTGGAGQILFLSDGTMGGGG